MGNERLKDSDATSRVGRGLRVEAGAGRGCHRAAGDAHHRRKLAVVHQRRRGRTTASPWRRCGRRPSDRPYARRRPTSVEEHQRRDDHLDQAQKIYSSSRRCSVGDAFRRCRIGPERAAGRAGPHAEQHADENDGWPGSRTHGPPPIRSVRARSEVMTSCTGTDRKAPLAPVRRLPIVRANFAAVLPISRDLLGVQKTAQRRQQLFRPHSGGLDTSIIPKWLQQTPWRRGCDLHGRSRARFIELEPARKKAELLGIKPQNIFIEDLREEFVRDYVFPMFRANAVYEGQNLLLGTSLRGCRSPIADWRLPSCAATTRSRMEPLRRRERSGALRACCYYAPCQNIRIIAPWREWDLRSREALIAFAEQHQIPIAKDKRGEAPFSVDANLLHASSEAVGCWKTLAEVPTTYLHWRNDLPESAPDKPTVITVDF